MSMEEYEYDEDKLRERRRLKVTPWQAGGGINVHFPEWMSDEEIDRMLYD